jgi:hypothetical protein
MTIDDVKDVCRHFGYEDTGPTSDLLLWLRAALALGEEGREDLAMLRFTGSEVDELREEIFDLREEIHGLLDNIARARAALG